VLVVYTVTTLHGPLVTLAVALAVTVGLHLWRRNLALSIVAGTVVYVALVSVFT
jgi:branched-subunit amino acid transport protein AzlD